jgi:adenylate cyclase
MPKGRKWGGKMDFSNPADGDGKGLDSAGGTDSDTPARAEIESALGAIKASPAFAGSQRLQSLLDHIVTETLKGAGDRLKEYTIAIDVFGRPPSFDPRVDSIVRVQASRLRTQLAAFYRKPPSGVTVQIDLPSGGYQPAFTRITPPTLPTPFRSPGPLSDTTVDPQTGEPPVTVLPRPAPSPAGRIASLAAGRPWVMPAILIAASLGLVAIFAAMFLGPRPVATEPGSEFVGGRPAGPVIFVARYQLIDGPDYAATLRDGIQIDLIDSLSRFPELTVLGYDTVYGASAEDARADPHGADFIVTGSIQASSNTLRVTSQLIHAKDNRVVWSEVDESALHDAASVLAVQSKIAGQVAGQLGQPHGVIQERLKEELTEDRAISMPDYLCVLESYEYSRAKSREKHAEVRACLEQVTRRSPRYAPAWAKLSWMYGDELRYNFNLRTDEAPPTQRALDAANRAVEANSSSAMAYQYLAIAQFQAGDTEGFSKSIEMALKLNPNNAEILADAAQMMILTDGADRGRELGERAIAFNPGHPPWYHQPLAIYHIIHGNKAEALRYAEAAAPDGAPIAAYILAAAQRLNGRENDAESTLREMGRKYPNEIIDKAHRTEFQASTRLPEAVVDLIFGD